MGSAGTVSSQASSDVRDVGELTSGTTAFWKVALPTINHDSGSNETDGQAGRMDCVGRLYNFI